MNTEQTTAATPVTSTINTKVEVFLNALIAFGFAATFAPEGKHPKKDKTTAVVTITKETKAGSLAYAVTIGHKYTTLYRVRETGPASLRISATAVDAAITFRNYVGLIVSDAATKVYGAEHPEASKAVTFGHCEVDTSADTDCDDDSDDDDEGDADDDFDDAIDNDDDGDDDFGDDDDIDNDDADWDNEGDF